LRKVFAGLAALLVLAVVAQFFLAASGAFDTAPKDESFQVHRGLGYGIVLFAVLSTIVAAQVHNHSRAVIEAELRRLARTAPSLRPDDLDIIDAALDELAESLLLARLRSLPQHTARLKRLFGTARKDP